MEPLFEETERYSLSVSPAQRMGRVDMVNVSLTFSDATTQEPGDYRLEYQGQDGAVDDLGVLQVQGQSQALSCSQKRKKESSLH